MSCFFASWRVGYSAEMKHAGRFGPPPSTSVESSLHVPPGFMSESPGEPFDSSRLGFDDPHRCVSDLNPSHPLGDDLNHI